jgi:ABC-type glycerol-3-phosphate transport system permease component
MAGRDLATRAVRPAQDAATLYMIPPVLFFLIVQRRMAGGLVAGSVKG